MRFPFGETVTVITAKKVTDPYSGEQTGQSWAPGDVTETEVYDVAVEPRPSSEPVQDARNAVVSGFTLYMDPDAEVTAADRIKVRGAVYDVLGDPALWSNPFTGWTPGLVVQVGRTEG